MLLRLLVQRVGIALGRVALGTERRVVRVLALDGLLEGRGGVVHEVAARGALALPLLQSAADPATVLQVGETRLGQCRGLQNNPNNRIAIGNSLCDAKTANAYLAVLLLDTTMRSTLPVSRNCF